MLYTTQKAGSNMYSTKEKTMWILKYGNCISSTLVHKIRNAPDCTELYNWCEKNRVIIAHMMVTEYRERITHHGKFMVCYNSRQVREKTGVDHIRVSQHKTPLLFSLLKRLCNKPCVQKHPWDI